MGHSQLKYEGNQDDMTVCPVNLGLASATWARPAATSERRKREYMTRKVPKGWAVYGVSQTSEGWLTRSTARADHSTRREGTGRGGRDETKTEDDQVSEKRSNI